MRGMLMAGGWLATLMLSGVPSTPATGQAIHQRSSHNRGHCAGKAWRNGPSTKVSTVTISVDWTRAKTIRFLMGSMRRSPIRALQRQAGADPGHQAALEVDGAFAEFGLQARGISFGVLARAKCSQLQI